MNDQRVRQSSYAVCGKSVRPGSGTVLHFGAGGRVHAVACLRACTESHSIAFGNTGRERAHPAGSHVKTRLARGWRSLDSRGEDAQISSPNDESKATKTAKSPVALAGHQAPTR